MNQHCLHLQLLGLDAFIPGCLVDIYSKLKLPDGNRCSDSFQTGDQIEIGTSETFKKFRSQLATLADVSTSQVIYRTSQKPWSV